MNELETLTALKTIPRKEITTIASDLPRFAAGRGGDPLPARQPQPNRAEYDAIVKMRNALNAYNTGGFPQRHLDLAKELVEGDERNPGWTSAYRRVCRAVDESHIVALTGGRGTGKTQAACAVAWRKMQAGSHPRYLRAVELFRAIRDRYAEDKTEAGVINPLCNVCLLVIDESHERAATDFEQRVLVEIIDRRYAAGKHPTILISNLQPQPFMESMGASIASRMQECGGIIEFTGWPSFRKPQ